MTKAKEICSKVNKDIRPQAETLAKAVFAMQEKLEQQIPIYEKMPLAQQVTVGTGETMLRQNPAVQEFRATVRDYSSALKSLTELVGTTNKETEQTAATVLELVRSRHSA